MQMVESDQIGSGGIITADRVAWGVQAFRAGVGLALAVALVLIAFFTHRGATSETGGAIESLVSALVTYAMGLFGMVLAIGLAIAAYIASRVDV